MFIFKYIYVFCIYSTHSISEANKFPLIKFK